jgi:hypothetical protein
MTTSARSRGQIPRLLLGPREHPRKDDKGGDNGCNDYCATGMTSPFVMIEFDESDRLWVR